MSGDADVWKAERSKAGARPLLLRAVEANPAPGGVSAGRRVEVILSAQREKESDVQTNVPGGGEGVKCPWRALRCAHSDITEQSWVDDAQQRSSTCLSQKEWVGMQQ